MCVTLWYILCCYNPLWILVTLVIFYQPLWYHEDPCSILQYLRLFHWVGAHIKNVQYVMSFGALKLSSSICLWCCDTSETDFCMEIQLFQLFKSYIDRPKSQKWARKQTLKPVWHENVNLFWSLWFNLFPLCLGSNFVWS